MLPDPFVKPSIDFLLFVNAGIYLSLFQFNLSDDFFMLLNKNSSLSALASFVECI